MPIVTMSLPVNVFLAALFTKALHLPKTTIGLITALPFACNFLQIFVSPFLARWLPAKLQAFYPAAVHTVSWGVFAVMLGFIPKDDPAAAGRWIALWFFLSSFAASIAGVGWNSWIQEWVPSRLRGKYFGRRNRLLSLSTVTFLLITGYVLERWNYALPAFQAVVIGAIILRIVSLKWIYDTPAGHEHANQGSTLGFLEQLALVRSSRSFIAFIAFGAIWSFAANCFGPFYHVFMFEQLEMSALSIGFLSTLAALGGALSLPAWGQLLDRYGNKSVMTLSLILWQLSNVVWCFLEPSNRNLIYGLWVWGGMSSAGFVLGQFTLMLKLIPVEAKNLAIGINLAITSLVAAAAPIIGGELLSWGLGRWSQSLTVYHLCFIIQPLVALLGATILLRVREPQASSLTNVVGAMRNIRTLSGIFGLSFMVNYVFYRPQKR